MLEIRKYPLLQATASHSFEVYPPIRLDGPGGGTGDLSESQAVSSLCVDYVC